MLQTVRVASISRRYCVAFWVALAALPIVFIAFHVAAASRNVVFWDEFDSALDFILRLDAGGGWRDFLPRLFAVNNEHRTVTSRLLFAVSYWLTGTVNFKVIGAVGDLFILAACGILIGTLRGWERRLQLGVVLAFVLFQLEHLENFLWSGSSIDHFQVVMLAAGALTALAVGTRPASLLGILLATLATFTLAHGCVVWPVGALLLAQQRRWRELAGWVVTAGLMLAAFFHGFEFNHEHHIVSLTAANFSRIVVYWLQLLGGPVTLGEARFAALPGVLLVAGLGFAACTGAARRSPALFYTALYAAAAPALIAFGRLSLAGAQINSRYLILGGLAWALLVFLLLDWRNEAERPFRRLLWILPALVGFNIAANVKYMPQAEGFVEIRDRAATRFKQFGEDGKDLAPLFPDPARARALLEEASRRGVYELPVYSKPARFPHAQPNSRIITYADELFVNQRAITIGGWAMAPDVTSRRGHIYVVLRSAHSTLIYSTITLQRPDVAKAYNEPRWRLSGFRAVIERDRLPAEDFEVGVLIDEGPRAEFAMLPKKVNLGTELAAQLASGQ